MARGNAPQTPPAARQAVVIRAGPPQDKGRKRDLAIGIVGLLLLVLAGGLVKALPEKDVLLPQFRVTVIELQEEAGQREGGYLSSNATGASNEEDQFYALELDDVYKIEVTVGFCDDVGASYSDSIEFSFFDPDGNLLVQEYTLSNGPPTIVNTTGLPFTAEYACTNVEDKRAFEVFPAPQDAIVTGVREGETEAEVTARLLEEYHVATAGEWRIHARLTAAGDCPTTQAGGDTERAIACQQQTQGRPSAPDVDTGNRYYIGGLTYYTYGLVVEKLEF